MFSGVRKLGESQDMADDIVQDYDEGGDIDFISVNYLSPDGGYPPQRISNYDEQLIQHQTLNGNLGVSRMAAPFTRMGFLMKNASVVARTTTGGPRGSAAVMTPRHVPAVSPNRTPAWMDRVGFRLMRR